MSCHSPKDIASGPIFVSRLTFLICLYRNLNLAFDFNTNDLFSHAVSSKRLIKFDT